MVVPIDEIQILAERLKNAGHGALVGFTRRELKLICDFSGTFWDEVDPNRKIEREKRNKQNKQDTGSEDAYI
ncbi:MAG: hypothetical protein JWQ71_3254 [Pedosphaera sp.]|nr:hypothetical protein [Pedosphaera sp.]